MKKEIIYDPLADKELQDFEMEVKKDFVASIDLLGEFGYLEFPDARKISKELFEIRIHHGGAYRGFYAYVGRDVIVILHFFQKKQQKSPLKNIHLAHNRLRKYVS